MLFYGISFSSLAPSYFQTSFSDHLFKIPPTHHLLWHSWIIPLYFFSLSLYCLWLSNKLSTAVITQLFIMFHLRCPSFSNGMEAPWGQRSLSVLLLMYSKCLEQDLAIGAPKLFAEWVSHRLFLRLHILTNLISLTPTGRHYYYYYIFFKGEKTEAHRGEATGPRSYKW